MIQFAQTLLRGRFFILLGILTSTLALTGCQSVLSPFGAMGETLHYAISAQPAGARQFLPGHEYLLIDIQGRQAVMALGQRQITPTPQGDVVDEYWYSGDREMMQLRNGRLHLLMGMTTEWRGNRSDPPAWHALQPGTPASHWLRTRDEMPSYRYGVQDRISTQALSKPPPSAPQALSAAERPLRWAQDQVETTTADGQRWAFTQSFALDQNQVIYSEQCITPKLCLRMQYKR